MLRDGKVVYFNIFIPYAKEEGEWIQIVIIKKINYKKIELLLTILFKKPYF